MDTPDLPGLAARIDTGAEAAETSRALVVFNLTDEPVSGVALFEATMTWPVNSLVPFVAVTDREGEAAASDLTDFTEGPDPKGRTDRRLLAFRLRFAVQDVPAQGWRTYLAFLAGDTTGEVVAPAPEGLDTATPGLQVVETNAACGHSAADRNLLRVRRRHMVE